MVDAVTKLLDEKQHERCCMIIDRRHNHNHSYMHINHR